MCAMRCCVGTELCICSSKNLLIACGVAGGVLTFGDDAMLKREREDCSEDRFRSIGSDDGTANLAKPERAYSKVL